MRQYLVRMMVVALVCSFHLGCSSITYDTAQDQNFRFGQLGTYAIVSDWTNQAVVRIHPNATPFINKVIEQQLQRLGYSRSYPGTPDFSVTYRLESEWDPRLTEEQKRQRLGFSGSHFPDADPRARNYQKLTFVIEMASPKHKKWIWRGAANGVRYAPGDSGFALSQVADELLKSFPPK